MMLLLMMLRRSKGSSSTLFLSLSLSVMFRVIAFVSVIRRRGAGRDGAERGIRPVRRVRVRVVVRGVHVVRLGVSRVRVVRRVVGGGVVGRGSVVLMRTRSA